MQFGRRTFSPSSGRIFAFTTRRSSSRFAIPPRCPRKSEGSCVAGAQDDVCCVPTTKLAPFRDSGSLANARGGGGGCQFVSPSASSLPGLSVPERFETCLCSKNTPPTSKREVTRRIIEELDFRFEKEDEEEGGLEGRVTAAL